MVMMDVLPMRPWQQGWYGERAPASLGRLSPVLFPSGAPLLCTPLPYLNPALLLLVCGHALKCIVDFKSCYISF